MSFYSKYLIGVGIFGIIGIFFFAIDYSNLSWSYNKELYWGIISLVALISSVWFYQKALKREKKL